MRPAVVVVNYGSTAMLERNLALSLESAAAEGLDPVTVVVDNFSTARERSLIEDAARRHGWLLEGPEENLGFGEGCNVGMLRAATEGADAFLLLNPDATIDGRSFRLLLERLTDRPLSLISPVVVDGLGGMFFDGADLYLVDGETRSVRNRYRHPDGERAEWISGACMALTLETFQVTQGFARDYFLYWEDVDLSWRAGEAGVELAVVPEAQAVHDSGGTQKRVGADGRSRVYYYYNIRNRLVFAARNLGGRAQRRWLLTTPRASWHILMRGGKRQLLLDPLLAWHALKGAGAGVAYLCRYRRRNRGRRRTGR